MAKVSAGLIGDEQTRLIVEKNNARELQGAFNQAIARALEEIGLAAERFAKQETPVDTGRLRNSMTHAISTSEKAVYVGTNVEYGPYIEMGTRRYKGRHMLQHAAENHTDYYRRILKKNLEG